MNQTENIPDVIEIFSNLTFQDNLKQSKVAEFSTLSDDLKTCASKVKSILNQKNPEFSRVQLKQFAAACIDKSITSRTEYKVECKSNVGLNFIGEAFLTLYIAKHSFRHNLSTKDHSDLRAKFSSEKTLSEFYDYIFATDECVFYYKTNPILTKSQKHLFIRALVGVLYACDEESLAFWFCNQIWKFINE